MQFVLANQSVSEFPKWEIQSSDFFGVSVHVATQLGDDFPSAVTQTSIVNALAGSVDVEALRGFFGTNGFSTIVNYNGSRMPCRLVPIPEFIQYCGLDSSPKLDKFRDHLNKIMTSVQRHGSYKEESGSFIGTLSEAQRANPTLVALMAAADAQHRLDQLNKDVKAIQGQVGTLDRRLSEDVTTLKSLVAYEQGHWTLSSWLSAHQIRLPLADVASEGLKCGAIARRIGARVPKKKIQMGSGYAATQWPIEVIKLWWPDFCRRHGFDLFWNV